MMEQRIEFPIRNLPSAFWKYRLHFLLIVFAITSGVVLYAFSQPNTYSSVARIMNVESDRSFSGSSNMLQIVGLGKERNDNFLKFTAIVGSRTFKERLAESLKPEIFAPGENLKGDKEALYAHAMGLVESSIHLEIHPMQSNVLNVIVTMQNSELPPLIANQVLVVLQEYITENSFTKAKMVRKYVEESILETKAAIFETANALSSFYQTNAVNPQKSMVEFPLQGELMALNADKRENIFIDPLLEKLHKKGYDKRTSLKKRLENIKSTPEQSYFDYLQEEYQILKSINLSLRQQYEIAKLEDVKQELAFQVLDKAKIVRQVGPRRRFMTTVGFVFSVLLGSFYVLVRSFFQQTSKS